MKGFLLIIKSILPIIERLQLLHLTVYSLNYLEVNEIKTKRKEKNRSFYGNVDHVIDHLSKKLSSLNIGEGFYGIGIGQGGIILRAYLELINNPPLKRLLTLGSPHSGMDRMPVSLCPLSKKVFCSRINSKYCPRKLFANLHSIIPFNFIKPLNNFGEYFDSDSLLVRINNEKFNIKRYSDNFNSLEKLILVKFIEDSLVSPISSTWFSAELIDGIITFPLDRCKYDFIGICHLVETGRVSFVSFQNREMSFDEIDDLIYRLTSEEKVDYEIF